MVSLGTLWHTCQAEHACERWLSSLESRMTCWLERVEWRAAWRVTSPFVVTMTSLTSLFTEVEWRPTLSGPMGAVGERGKERETQRKPIKCGHKKATALQVFVQQDVRFPGNNKGRNHTKNIYRQTFHNATLDRNNTSNKCTATVIQIWKPYLGQNEGNMKESRCGWMSDAGLSYFLTLMLLGNTVLLPLHTWDM